MMRRSIHARKSKVSLVPTGAQTAGRLANALPAADKASEGPCRSGSGTLTSVTKSRSTADELCSRGGPVLVGFTRSDPARSASRVPRNFAAGIAACGLGGEMRPGTGEQGQARLKANVVTGAAFGRTRGEMGPRGNILPWACRRCSRGHWGVPAYRGGVGRKGDNDSGKGARGQGGHTVPLHQYTVHSSSKKEGRDGSSPQRDGAPHVRRLATLDRLAVARNLPSPLVSKRLLIRLLLCPPCLFVSFPDRAATFLSV